MSEVKTLTKLIEKKAESSYEKDVYDLQHLIEQKLSLILDKNYTRSSLYAGDLSRPVKEFLKSILTEEEKEKYIKRKIEEESEKILLNVSNLANLIENMGNQ